MKEGSIDHSQVLRQFPYGLYVLGASRNGHPLFILANWVSQVSFSPPLIAAAIEVEGKMHQYISDSGCFSVNVLPGGGKELALAFLKSQEPIGGAVNGHSFQLAKHGSPLLDEASSCVECKVVARLETGDHTLFVGQITQSVLHAHGHGMTLKESGLNYQRKKS
jgi:flavin reductase (DIM6/NTAB) family NADH-FMN oxidoreductase RutF